MPIPVTSKSLRESYRGSLLLERLAGIVFPDAATLQAAGCFSTLFFYDVNCPDFCIRLSDYCLKGDPDWDEESHKNPILIFQFALHGDLHYKLEGIPMTCLPEGSFNLFTIPSIKEIGWRDAANRQTTTLDIYFSPDYLQKLTTGYPELSRLLAKRKMGFAGQLGFSHGSVCAEMLRDILAIINCNYTGDLLRIYLKSKIAELLLPALDRLTAEFPDSGTPIPLKKADVEKLYASRQYLLMNMENPPTLKELAQKMGINDFKLKKGYKQLFGTTIFEDFHRTRMERSMQDLLESDKTILEVALLYGYQDVSNFSIAFKRHFGSSPGYFRREWVTRHK